jgi:hypothetical protein
VLSSALTKALYFVGIDWAAHEHAVCVTDATGTIVSQLVIKHSADGITVSAGPATNASARRS